MSQNSSPNNVPSAKQGTADSLAAPGRVGAGGTKKRRHPEGCTCITCDCPADYSGRFAVEPTLEQFQLWLETRAHEASHATWPSSFSGESLSNHEFRCNAMIHSCRAATALLMMFKLEQGA